jgi:hypothetical protein
LGSRLTIRPTNGCAIEQAGKKRFFLKKEAKTLASLGARWFSTYLTGKSFLVLFFKKEQLPSESPGGI